MKKKEVRLLGHGPIFVGPQYKSPWEDVWLRWKEGRKLQRACPTLITKPDLVADIQFEKEFIEENKHEEWMQDGSSQKWLATMEQALEVLEQGGYYVHESAKKENCATIWTPKDWIDRAEAQEMLRHYLKGVTSAPIKFSWKKPRIVVSPMSFRPR